MPALPIRPRRAPWTRIVGGAMAATLIAGACTGGDDDAVTSTTTASTTSTTTIPRDDDGQLVLGIYLPVTGAGSELGQPMIAAVEDAVDRINTAGGVLGQSVRTIQADEGAGTGLGELLEQGVDAIVGPASSLTALTQLGAAVDPNTGVVVCSPSATSLLLDDYPDNTFLFRTAPSDSLQMAAIARQVQRTGARSVAVGYLDDPYGRGLHAAFLDEIEARRLAVPVSVGFSGDQTDLSGSAAALLDADPGVIVVLGDADDGGRLIAALDAADSASPQVIVNDAIREARQTIQSLSGEFRSRLTGVAPLASSTDEDAPDGFFAAHAVDCVNLIALSVVVAGTDAPRTFRTNMAGVSADGRACDTFQACALLLEQGLNIDYGGASGSAELSNATGDPIEARFESFSFEANGTEIRSFQFEVP
ncbi:MAG: ABC transporter substrate-binding protein [Ilumatobacteraceae bacterium]|nr:ABC transporter substrate-binding protein [Ilumatobacteraceae bacterium]